MQPKFTDQEGIVARVWFRMSTSNISHGFWAILLAALLAGLLDVLISGVRSEPSIVLIALGWEEDELMIADGTTSTTDSTMMVPMYPLPSIADTFSVAPTDALAIHPLAPFIQALEQLQQTGRSVRIGYFGDSMIEGDLVTQSLRYDLQERFGGRGVGFVPITSQTYGFRRSIYHRFSGDWKDFNLLAPQAPDHEYGISGEYFLTKRADAAGSTWVRYKGRDLYPSTERFERVRLFYGRRKRNPEDVNQQFVWVSTDYGKDTLALDQNSTVNEVLVCAKPTEEVQLNFQIPRDLPVYGLSFESESGIFIDNFASRGNSGMNLVEIPAQTLQEFHKQLKYDLIVLQFGLNVVSTRRKNYDSYERGMERVVRHFQEHAPGAAILLVSCSDKSTRLRGRMQTDPSVPLVVAAQQRVADRTGVAFLNLFEGMGGANSMIQWVRDDLARKDYTHPNRKGAERVGDIVRDYLMDTYRQHQDSTNRETFTLR